MDTSINRRKQLLAGAIVAGLLIAVSVTSSFVQMHRLASASTTHREVTDSLTALTEVRQNSSQLALVTSQQLLVRDPSNFEDEMAGFIDALGRSVASLDEVLEGEDRTSALFVGMEGVRDHSREMIRAAEAFYRASTAGRWNAAQELATSLGSHQFQLGQEIGELVRMLHARDMGLSLELESARRDAAVPVILSILGLILGAIFLTVTLKPTSEPWVKSAQLGMIERLASLLSVAQSLHHLFDVVRQQIFTQVEATGLSIMLLAPDRENLEWVYGYEDGKEVDLSYSEPIPISQGLSGHVVRTGRMLLVNKGVQEKQIELGSRTVGRTPAAWLGLPLVVANELVGVLAIEDDRPFPDRVVQLMGIVAGPVAIAIHNFMQFEKVKSAMEAQARQQVQLQAAAEIAAAATSTLQLDELMAQAVALIKQRFDYYFVGIYLVDREAGQAVLEAGTGESGRLLVAQRYQVSIGGASVVGEVTHDGMPRILQDVTLDESWSPSPHLPATRAELVMPLRVREHVIGALSIQESRSHAFGPELLGPFQTMSDQLAVAIENAQLLARAEERAKYQQKLNEISAQLYRATDVPEIVGIGLRALSERLSNGVVQLALGVEGAGEQFGTESSQLADDVGEHS